MSDKDADAPSLAIAIASGRAAAAFVDLAVRVRRRGVASAEPGEYGPAAAGHQRRSRRAVAADASRCRSIESEAQLRALLAGLSGVDAVGAEARAAKLATRSLKKSTKLAAIDLAISMVDLTTLEGADTPGRVRSLCAKALRPDPRDDSTCRAPRRCASTPTSSRARRVPCAGRSVKVASVATAFPSGRASLAVKLLDVREAVAAGADEIDMVIDRGAFLSGRLGQVFDEIVAVKEACGDAHLKVILETGELVTYDNVRRASWIAMLGGRRLHQDLDGQGRP